MLSWPKFWASGNGSAIALNTIDKPLTLPGNQNYQSPARQPSKDFLQKRVARIELATKAWEAFVLPLNYTRRCALLNRIPS